jgi:DNA-binding SARP family transcriptional activator/Tfp pilus assembly protein PilF
MERRMWLGLLGSLTVQVDGLEMPVMPAKQRSVLAALGLPPGQVLSPDTLSRVLWDAEPPTGAMITIRSYVKRLRQSLGPVAGARVVTRTPGYLLYADEDEVDVLTFRSLCERGGQAARAGDWTRAADLLDKALALWRGKPLADVPSEVLHREQVPQLEQLQLQALESRMSARLNLGQHAQLIPELQALVAAHPFREDFHGQFMTALYRAGRQGEALAAYQRARDTLVAELGVEPGEELQRLHHDILAGYAPPRRAPGGAPERAVNSRGRREHVVPRQLPAVAPNFAGREAALAELDALLADSPLPSVSPSDTRPPDGAVMVITAVGGMAGVGKTALATRWAHRVADRFPDGQLYVNLRGFDPLGAPVEPAVAIRGFLESLGVSAERIPADAQAQAGLYRSLLAGRRVLVVLDNARDETQVRPLLPGSPSCLVLVTSRTRLTGLAAAEGARLVSLDVLSGAEAREMLAARLGAVRVAAEPAAVAALVAACGRLPLALVIVAARVAERPELPLADLVAELREGLDALETGDTATSVQGVFGWSYRQLEAPKARLFRRLGLQPGPDISVHAAARLADLPVRQARELLRGLVRNGLLTEPQAGRYVFHDLLRVYATRQAETVDSGAERRAALTRLFDDYLAMAGAAINTVAPGERNYRPDVGTTDADAPSVGTAAAARNWLDAERANLVATAAHAARNGWPGHAIRLATILFRYLHDGSHYPDILAVDTSALDAARLTGDLVAQADAIRRRCGIDFRQGRYQRAIDQLELVLPIYRDAGEQMGYARTLTNLGVVLRATGRYHEAQSRHEQAVSLARAAEDRYGEALASDALGNTLCRLGRYEEAAKHHQRAIALFHRLGEPVVEGFALDNLGEARYRQGRLAEAADCHQRALAINREVGCRFGEASALNSLGGDLCGQGHHELAAEHHRQALVLFREEGHPAGQAAALSGLGDVLVATGHLEQARVEYEQALALAGEVSDRRQEARAHDGLGRAYLATRDTGRSRDHWEKALGHYAEMGLPEADEVRSALAGLRETAQS